MPLIDRAWTAARSIRGRWSGRAIVAEDRWLHSEGGWKLHARLHHPPSPGPRPAVLIVPGIGGTSRTYERWKQPVQATELALLGVTAMALDLSGRGPSWGSESWGGPENHGDVRAALRILAAEPDVDSTRVAVLSFSLGCAAVAGALADGSPPPIAFWIDWEGPSDREIITAGGRMTDPAAGHALDDDAYWWPREAVRHVGRTGVPYVRFQSSADHAQPGEFRHADRMVRAAAAGSLPWFQLNDHPRGTVPSEPEWIAPGPRVARNWMSGKLRELLRLP